MGNKHIFNRSVMKYILLLFLSILSLRADQFKLSEILGDNVLAVSEKYRIIARYAENKVVLIGPDKSEVDLSTYGYTSGGFFGLNNSGEFVWSEIDSKGQSNLYFVNRKKKIFKIENAFVSSLSESSTNWNLNENGEFMYIQSQISEDMSQVTNKLMTLSEDGKLSGIMIPENVAGESIITSYEDDKVFLQSNFYPIPNNYNVVKRKFFVYTKKNGFRKLNSDFNLSNYVLGDSNKNDYLVVIGKDQKISLLKYNAKNSELKFVKKFSSEKIFEGTQIFLNNINEVIATFYTSKAPFYSYDIVYLRGNKSTKFLCSFKNSSKVKTVSLYPDNLFEDSRKFVVYTSKPQYATALIGNESKNWCVDTSVKVIGSCAGYFDENLRQVKNFPKEGMRCSFEVTLKNSDGKALKGLTAVITKHGEDLSENGNVIASGITDSNGKAVIKVTFEKKELYNDSYFLHAPYADKEYRGMSAYIGNQSGV